LQIKKELPEQTYGNYIEAVAKANLVRFLEVSEMMNRAILDTLDKEEREKAEGIISRMGLVWADELEKERRAIEKERLIIEKALEKERRAIEENRQLREKIKVLESNAH